MEGKYNKIGCSLSKLQGYEMPAAHGNVSISILLLCILGDFSPFCVDASPIECVCLTTKPEEQAARQKLLPGVLVKKIT